MIKLMDSERSLLVQLCSCRSNDNILFWFLDGNSHCTAWVDNITNPKEAIIIVVDFCYLLGQLNEISEIECILIENAKNKVIIPCSTQWEDYLKNLLPRAVRSYTRYAMKQETKVFDIKKLLSFTKKIDTLYHLIPIDEIAYNDVLKTEWAADGCCFFSCYEDFKNRGLGYVIYKESELICIASSYISCNNIIEITIGTLKEYRKKGLATACASQLILSCIEKGLYPKWEAANSNSLALAIKLGYHLDKAFDIYTIV